MLRADQVHIACGIVEAVSPEQQIEALRRELAERDAILAIG